jgi:hypothetical protein
VSDTKNFLARWSERKLQPEKEKQPAEEKKPPDTRNTDERSTANAGPDVEFDISQLPSLESITANSDIRVFLQKGVPSSLRHAALRRAWSADPAIRDFIGLSENSWDFNKPDELLGFGPLDTDDIKKLAAHFFGDPLEEDVGKDASEHAAAAHTPSNNREAGDEGTQETQIAGLEDQSGPDIEGRQLADHDNKAGALRISAQQKYDAALQHEDPQSARNDLPAPRRHGGAVPK